MPKIFGMLHTPILVTILHIQGHKDEQDEQGCHLVSKIEPTVDLTLGKVARMLPVLNP